MKLLIAFFAGVATAMTFLAIYGIEVIRNAEKRAWNSGPVYEPAPDALIDDPYVSSLTSVSSPEKFRLASWLANSRWYDDPEMDRTVPRSSGASSSTSAFSRIEDPRPNLVGGCGPGSLRAQSSADASAAAWAALDRSARRALGDVPHG